ncbi:hypothetical protein AMIS_60280 [Actinoplanes missouriensis 431]|uniref:DUF4352 domain-containing protein n=1 Tax=Actinoplanes missouriensis (strain ATCC 14538 / DSM 43046 / CBS 188.64 / JCM 3121 / NBRC 102363 / NCIMB 12654 / NRRL B-3342 / UNCC 431) TaxID=512565 RepID=I0HE11_ACTM4|nr:DUF4352 domain-containing protein [Actinoplanes missouriensis]BAL91248.1 hypothetical protein AMIS_60280 [Actinoplanes missouriensis 431]
MSNPQQAARATSPAGKARTWPWIAGSAVALVLLGCGSASSSDDAAGTSGDAAAVTEEKTESAKTGDKKEEKKAAGIGDAVRDGKFEFTVSKMKCGVENVGSDLLGQKAQGEYCLIDIKVKNIGKEAQTFTDSAQKAFDAKEVEYSVDSSAAIYANGESQLLLSEINPGNSAKGKLVFDVPAGTKLTSLELHDSVFSGGVTVTLK